jgi:hypothetical protein
MQTAARNLLNYLLLTQWKCDVFTHFPISRSCWHKCFTVTCVHNRILPFTANSFVKWYTESVMICQQYKLNCYGEITKVCTDLKYWYIYIYICITDRQTHTQNIHTNAILIQQNCPRCKMPAPGVYNSNRATEGNEAPTYQLICGRPHS